MSASRPKPESPEVKVSGLNAVKALFARRPKDIRRAYVTEETLPALRDLLHWCAQEKIAYHVVTNDDLTQIVDSVHHDGAMVIAREKKPLPLPDLLTWARGTTGPATLLLLQDVKNPHNVGAILRVCAHFGVRAVLCAGDTAGLSMATMRTAEGGAEWLDLVEVGDGGGALQSLKGLGFGIVATSSHARASLSADPLPARTVLLFGSESEGLSRQLAELADRTVAIPGAGTMESLNVACASSVMLWEHFRRYATPAEAAPRTDAPSRADAGPAARPPSRHPSTSPGMSPARMPSSSPPAARKPTSAAERWADKAPRDGGSPPSSRGPRDQPGTPGPRGNRTGGHGHKRR